MGGELFPKTWQEFMNSSGYMPVVINSIERHLNDSWSKTSSQHEYYEMVYAKKGVSVFEIEGTKVTVGPNDIIIIKPHRTHSLRIQQGSTCEFIVLYFSFTKGNGSSGNSYPSEIPIEDFINFYTGQHTGPFLKLKVNQKNDIITLLNRIVAEKSGEQFGSDFLIHLLILELFVMISRVLKLEWERSIIEDSPQQKELVNLAVQFIQNHYERDINLHDICGYVFLSPSYFTRIFKKETGYSPINFLINTRIERAKELLACTDEKVSEIALSVGFSSQQRFNEAFKKNTGMTPLEYRRKMRGRV
ncbi:transcriptional regulator, AraC family [Thermoclostridium stercorarium subsp. stercorarium DSM 8532]|uniref:Transcriptional regulator, AraC family n=3 Tax=Thermoclostridium stercorarium TaxID=1510 RepID=L7VSQ8_THES1|nr:AraC family transcriptional regulator [Thermoclostridium stercorarium]AGC69619.1 transcriptional regulator, AraC family [Thermoclostridium stercorarium subsp. stercorarium DSM 8532]AGI40571.1 DNA-binding domain-containing protein [Thermoclostridium stercorarium subsp. stercorarium DSM 8532]